MLLLRSSQIQDQIVVRLWSGQFQILGQPGFRVSESTISVRKASHRFRINMTATELATHKVVTILDVTSNCHLASRITEILLLDGPFAPIKSIYCPRSQIIAIRGERRIAVA